MMRIISFKKAMIWLPLFVCLLTIATVPVSLGYQPAGTFNEEPEEITGENAISKIVSTLAIRNPDRKVLDKAAEKLYVMNNRDLRLIASLCDRISAADVTAGADIAFSLITAMIVLS